MSFLHVITIRENSIYKTDQFPSNWKVLVGLLGLIKLIKLLSLLGLIGLLSLLKLLTVLRLLLFPIKCPQ